jgi:hypothetical protein
MLFIGVDVYIKPQEIFREFYLSPFPYSISLPLLLLKNTIILMLNIVKMKVYLRGSGTGVPVPDD